MRLSSSFALVAVLASGSSHRAAAADAIDVVYDVDVAHRFDPRAEVADVVSRCAATMRRRLELLGQAPAVTVSGTRIRVKLSPDAALATTRRLLERTFRFELHTVEERSEFMRTLIGRVRERSGRASGSDDVAVSMFDDPYLNAASPRALEAGIAATKLRIPAGHVLAFADISQDESRWRTFYLDARAELANDDVAGADVNVDRYSRAQQLTLTLTPSGARRLDNLTARSVGHQLAVLLDGGVLMAPTVRERITAGRLSIALQHGMDPEMERAELEQIAIGLRAGALAAPVRLLPGT